MQIELHNVNKTYQTEVESIHVLKNIDFTVESGQWLMITGPSGSGKTTLLRCISALEQVDSGEIILGGSNLAALSDAERRKLRKDHIGYIFQDFQLFDQFDVLTNVMIPQLPDHPEEKVEKRARELLTLVGLNDRERHMPRQLSGGEKQRTAIARALMNNPKLILCDEPTGNLDAGNRDHIMTILKEINQKGVTIVLVTHDTELIEYGDLHFRLSNDGELVRNGIKKGIVP